jgi:hypothetical protein
MTVPVRYTCPRCGAVATLERHARLADKSVTPYPLEGWTYADPEPPFEAADGVRLLCGEHTEGEGCGEPFYLSFVRFEAGEEVEHDPEVERVTLGLGPRDPWRQGGP